MTLFAIINNRTGEVMEHAETMGEAVHIQNQYNEMGRDNSPENEYYGTYRIEED